MHWDHEPTPNPSQEGNGQDADRCVLPSSEGSGVGRFMESLDAFLARIGTMNRFVLVLLLVLEAKQTIRERERERRGGRKGWFMGNG